MLPCSPAVNPEARDDVDDRVRFRSSFSLSKAADVAALDVGAAAGPLMSFINVTLAVRAIMVASFASCLAWISIAECFFRSRGLRLVFHSPSSPNSTSSGASCGLTRILMQLTTNKAAQVAIPKADHAIYCLLSCFASCVFDDEEEEARKATSGVTTVQASVAMARMLPYRCSCLAGFSQSKTTESTHGPSPEEAKACKARQRPTAKCANGCRNRTHAGFGMLSSSVAGTVPISMRWRQLLPSSALRCRRAWNDCSAADSMQKIMSNEAAARRIMSNAAIRFEAGALPITAGQNVLAP